MKKILVSVLISAIFISGCHKSKDNGSTPTTLLDMTSQDDDLVIPTSLWKTFEEVYPNLTDIAPAKDEKSKEEKKEEAPKEVAKKKDAKPDENEEMFKRRPSIDPLPLSVLLIEKTSGVLANQNFNVKFGPGGGTIDYKDILPEKRNGTFFLKVKYEEAMDPKVAKVFFLSNSPKRPEVKLGNGCNKYFDITKYWNGLMKGGGLALNTVEWRHLGLTAGTFFFVSPFNGKLRLGHLTLTDSRHKELLCSAEVAK